MSKLHQRYKKEIVPKLFAELELSSIMQVPKLEKVVINMGVGNATTDADYLKSAVTEIELITNQKPIITKAKNSIASFKLREGQAIGAKVTLRNKNMWAFVEKLVSIAIPRIRDFRGLFPSSFDGKGNYTLGIKEQIIFTEVHYDNVKKIRGMDITFVMSTNSDEHALALLKSLGFPFIMRNK